MSIRLLAKDLYRAQREVERLEQRLEAAPMDKRMAVEEAIRKARALMNQLQNALDGQIGR